MFESQIPRRCWPGVEMLMERCIRRHDQSPDLPVIALRCAAFRPHQRVAFAAEYDHMSAGPMLVSFLICPDRELGDVTAERATRRVETDMAAAGAAPLRRPQREVGGSRRDS